VHLVYALGGCEPQIRDQEIQINAEIAGGFDPAAWFRVSKTLNVILQAVHNPILARVSHKQFEYSDASSMGPEYGPLYSTRRRWVETPGLVYVLTHSRVRAPRLFAGGCSSASHAANKHALVARPLRIYFDASASLIAFSASGAISA
jgi:hypothetical protein